MKTKFKIILLLHVIFFLAFTFISAGKHQSENQKVKETYISYLDQIINSLERLNSNSYELKQDYLDLRQQFKTVEFLLAHIDQEYYLKHFNGAPIPKLEKKAPDMNILEPKGFQVLDELIFNGEEEINTRSVDVIINKLHKNFIQIRDQHKNQNFSNTIILESVQFELIRMYTQGLTGFDTPGSLNGLSDAKNTLIGLRVFLKKCDFKLENILYERIDNCINYINQNNDFNHFDRLEFYKGYWQPTYSTFLQLSENLKTEYLGLPREVNLSAGGLFESDFLNKEAYIDIPSTYLNKEMINLGKELFFSPILSKDKSMSCGTCHSPELAFSDAKKTSVSPSNETEVFRNSPGLWNSVYTKSYFYDLRASKLGEQFEHVIFNEKEFNTSMNEILERLRNHANFNEKFRSQFPEHRNNPVNVYTFKSALSAYVSSLTGFNTIFDSYVNGESNIISKEVKKGYNLFMGKAACATCHFPPTFSGLVPPYFNDSESEVLGVPVDTNYTKLDVDLGRFSNKKPKEHHSLYKNSFKTTSVRTASNTAPYMHNGVFETLGQVLEFYNNGGGGGHGLHVPNQTLADDSLNLDSTELKALESFINSLEFQPLQ